MPGMHLFDEIGVGRQEDAFGTDAEARKGAVLARGVEQKVKEAGAELANVLPPMIVLSFPKIPSGMDSHRKAESSHPYQ